MLSKDMKGVLGLKGRTLGNAAPPKKEKQRDTERPYQITPDSSDSKIRRNLCDKAREKGHAACEECKFCGDPCQWGAEAVRRKLMPKKKKEVTKNE